MRAAAQLFSKDYVHARARFREAAARSGLSLSAYSVGQSGPFGEELTIDVAIGAAPRAKSTLVVSSGTHGVEGYFGSAVQLALLSQPALLREIAQRTRLVLIHSINPYGFAYKRRVNEDNVDQNRNFVLAGHDYVGAPEGYRALTGLLNPESAPARFDLFLLLALRQVLRFGFSSLKNAVAQGQYDYARGLFFGGRSPSASQLILGEHLAAWIGQPERVLHVDLHTGAGKWGRYALCVDLPADSDRVTQLKREFGSACVQGFDSKGVLYEIKGALGRWLEQRFEGVQYDCLLAEFGTYAPLRVLSAMRFENRVHHYAAVERGNEASSEAQTAKLLQRARHDMLEMFCPRSPAWRRSVIERALSVLQKSAHALR